MTVKIDANTDPDRLNEAMAEWQDAMIRDQRDIEKEFSVSASTASAIQYLRTRSRWTQGKEDELITRDHDNNPIDLGEVLSGEF